MGESDVDRAQRVYDEARLACARAEMALEDASMCGAVGAREGAADAFGAAAAAVAAAGDALAAARAAVPVSFEALLGDPTTQLDAGAAVLRSILEYTEAPKATAAPAAHEPQRAWRDHVFVGAAASFRFGADAPAGSPHRIPA